jgi:pyridoxal phosphate enzyme (YggS family)
VIDTGLVTRYRDLVARIAKLAADSGRSADQVALVAVSKTQPAEAIADLYALGHRDFGENYVQELVEKAEALRERCPGIRWHFIGHLQTNKVKALVPHVHVVHSVDSERLALELDKRWRALRGEETQPLPCFVEVNIDDEPSKSGVPASQAPVLAHAIAQCCPSLKLRGLMAIPAVSSSAAPFAALRELEQRCRPSTHGALSMGMSGDFEVAIAQGATHVRVGTALFGPRPPAK